MTAELRAWAYLSRVAEAPCTELAALVAKVGAVEAAERVSRGAVCDELIRRTEARRGIDQAAADLEHIGRLGGRLITPDDDEWPTLSFVAFSGVAARRRRNFCAPLALWVRGESAIADLALRAAALVGTRAATRYGEHVAAELATGLCDRDVAVVSGAAYGIDGAAHRAAMAAEGHTVAVLAAGMGVVYPAGHSALLARVARNGLLVTEYPPGTRPARHRFLVRNRLVAALSGATVVVEAGLRSGAANTAAWARALGRVVCAVPGPCTSAASAGCHNLIRDGAELVSRAEHIVEIVGKAGELSVDPARPASVLDGLSDAEKLVYEAIPASGSRSVDELSVESGIGVARLQGPLAILELAGLAIRDGGRWRLAHRPDAPRSGGAVRRC